MATNGPVSTSLKYYHWTVNFFGEFIPSSERVLASINTPIWGGYRYTIHLQRYRNYGTPPGWTIIGSKSGILKSTVNTEFNNVYRAGT